MLRTAAKSFRRNTVANSVMPAPAPGVERRDPVNLSTRDAARARALSLWFEATANARPDVLGFRATFLGGILGPEDARRFLRAWPNRIFSAAAFEDAFERGSVPKPYLDDSGEPVLLERGQGGRDGPAVRVDPPGWTLTSWRAVDALLFPETLSRLRYREVGDDDRHYWHAEASYLDGSVIGRLAEMGRELQRSYPWNPDDAAFFVLTGRAPYVSAATVRREWSTGAWTVGGKVTLEVQPWVSVDTVSRAYRDAQRGYFQGRTQRAVEEKAAELFAFIVQRTDFRDNGESTLLLTRKRTWLALVREWNGLHAGSRPAWCYAPHNWRNFRRDYKRAEEAITYPPICLAPHIV